MVRSASKNPKIVLFASGNSLEVMSGRTNGYRNIRSRGSTASLLKTSVYHLDGNKYKLWKETREENRE